MKIFFSFLLFLVGITFSQKYNSMDFSFSNKEKNIANTVSNTSYLTTKEKEIFFYLNLVRINPKLFAQTFLLKNKHQIDCF